MKSPAFALPSGLPRLSLGRPSNRTVILIGLAAYAVILAHIGPVALALPCSTATIPSNRLASSRSGTKITASR